MQTITSRQNDTVKRIASLTEKKARRETGLFRFDGMKLFREALTRGLKIEYLVLREDASSELFFEAERAVNEGRLSACSVLCVNDSVFAKLSEEKSPEGVITVCRLLTDRHRTVSDVSDYNAEGDKRILLAESLRDPGNLGTVIRSCAALGIERLVISDDCADLYNPRTVRAAMGGLFALPIDIIRTEELPLAISSLRANGRKIYAAALRADAKSIGDLDLCCGDAFVIGNEGHGLGEAVCNACDACVIIPMTEGSESLNAAAAAAICIWETVKIN